MEIYTLKSRERAVRCRRDSISWRQRYSGISSVTDLQLGNKENERRRKYPLKLRDN